MAEREKSGLEKKILELNQQEIFRYRDTKLPLSKKLAYDKFGWYADSIGEALWETIQKLVVILDELTSRNNELGEENEKLRKAVEELSARTAACEGGIGGLSARTAACEGGVGELSGRAASYEERFAEAFRRLDENNLRFDSHDQRLDENNLRFDSHDKRLDECNERFDVHDRRLDEVNLRLDGHDSRLDENNLRLDGHDSRLDENNLRLDGHDKRLDENNLRLDGHDKRLDENNLRLDGHDSRLDENNLRLDGHDKRLDENNLRLDGHDKRLDENNLRLDGHDKRLDENNLRFDSHDKRLDENNLRFDAHDKRLDECNERFDSHDARLDRCEQRLDSFSGSGVNANSFAQSGEDMITDYVLRFLRTDMNNVKYLDLGANHAKELSNTYKFYVSGGRGVLVEANPELIPELEEQRRGDVILNRVIVPSGSEKDSSEFYVLSGDGLSTVDHESALEACRVNPEISIKSVYTVKNITVKEITDTYFKDGIDILNIDLEGLEYDILREFDLTVCRPKIIILESIEYKPYLVTEKSENKKLSELLADNNYIEYAFTGINSLYVDRDFVSSVNSEIIEEINRKKN